VQADPGADHGCGRQFWSLSSPQSGIELQKGRESTRGWPDTLKPIVQKGFIAVDCVVVDWILAPRSAVLALTFCLLAPAVTRAQDSHTQDSHAQDSPIVLVPHRAVYDLALEQTRGNSQVAGVRGRILYDFGGNACQGYSLEFRQVSELSSGEGDDKDSTSDQRSTTWEGADAKNFKFTSTNYINDKLVESVDGHAERGTTVTAVDIEKPEHKNLDLDAKVVFPTEHMVRAIAAARAGQSILNFPVYDGSDTGDKVLDTLTVIGRKIEAGERQHDDAAANEPKLANAARWPVTISYFDRTKKVEDKEQTPAYAIGFELYDNGISRALTLDYNDFVVSGKLSSLELKEPKPCP
jgi:rhodanese-related sulfurtransferase